MTIPDTAAAAARPHALAPVGEESPRPFADPRLVELAGRIESGVYDLLSLDVFDTLVWRAVARPSDAFFLLADELYARGAMRPSASRESFVATRIQAETRARECGGSREVTLEEIWREFPKGYLLDFDPSEGPEIELDVERSLVRIHADVAALAERARNRGMKVALVSDTYFTAGQLRRLTGIPADFVIASCEHRVSKYHGLHRVLLAQSQAKPERVLHVGDNEQADGEGPRAFRIDTYHLAKFPPEYEGLAEREWPRALGAREAMVRRDDGGLTALRGRALFRSEAPYERWGAGVLGPVVAGFCDWVVERCAILGIEQALCLMREGRILSQVLGVRADGPAAHEFFVSRYAALKAAILDGSEEELRAFVFRPSPESRGKLLNQLGLTSSDVAGDPEERLAPEACAALAVRIAGDAGLRRKVVAASREARRRLLAHLDSLLGAQASGTAAVVDLGYKGTIQGCLHRILARERPRIRLHGFYLVTSAEASEAQRSGAVLEGWLAENGQPIGVSHTFVRSPEIVEQSLMADCGTTRGYGADGAPELEEQSVDPAQRSAIADVQAGLLAWARIWSEHRARNGIADTGGLRPLYRAIMTSAVARPLPEEVELFGVWGHDENFGSNGVRALAIPAGMSDWEVAHMSAHQLSSIPHTELYWPFGLAALIAPEMAEAVANIYTRSISPEAFDAPEPLRTLRFFWDAGSGLTARNARSETYRLNHRGRRWQRFSMRLDGGPLRGFAMEIGSPGEVLRLEGARIHRHPIAGEPEVDTLAANRLALEGYRRLHGALWLVEGERRLIRIPAPHLAGFRGVVHVDLFFGLLPGG